MKDISDLLGPLKKLIPKGKIVRESLNKNIQTEIGGGYFIKKEDFDYRNGVIFLKISPNLKNAIRLKKDKLIGGICEETGINILDIK